MATITIHIKDKNQSIEIPWTIMNVQQALEVAYNQVKKNGGDFDFSVRYYGASLGYLVTMIDGIYDNPNDPNDYWLYYINGKPASVGIDSYIVQPNDIIMFDYIPYNENDHGGTITEVKYKTK